MKRFINDVRKYAGYIIYITRKKLKAEVANSYLNWIWWVLEPFCEMLIFTFVFGNLLKNNERNYSAYIYSGLITWKFFSQTMVYSVALVRIKKDIMIKVYVPKFIFLMENMCINGFKLLISFGILIAMMFVLKIPVGWTIFYVIPVYFVMFMISFSIGVLLLHFGVFVDDLSYIVSILLGLVFYVSGIFYNIDETFPVFVARIIKLLNPMAAITAAAHDALFAGRISQIGILCLWFGIAMVISIIGVRTVYKYENSYVKVV